MPGKDRCHNKEYFGPWLIRQINSNAFDGVCWLNEERTLFRLPWKHLNIRSVDENDYAIFKAWAIQSGRYNADCEDPPVYKTNFRCALKSVVYQNRKMFTEYRNNSLDQHDPHKIFRFHGVHEDCSPVLLPASSTALEEENLQNDIEHDEDYRLRTSPAFLQDNPLSSVMEGAVIEELLRKCNLDSEEDGTSSILLSRDEITRVDHVFQQTAPSFPSEVSCVTGYRQPLAMEPASVYDSLLYCEGSPYQGYFNEYVETAPAVQQNYGYAAPQTYEGTVTVPEAHVSQHGPQQQNAQQAVMMNATHDYSTNCAQHTDMAGYSTPSPMGHVPTAQEMPAPVCPERRIPKLTSWEITISYRGKEFDPQCISKKCYITYTGQIPATEDVDIVRLPRTDTLVSENQIKYTDQILNSVGGGLVLEVNPNDYTLYATRVGNARVYWSLSGSLKTKENASQSQKLERDVPTQIFNFSQFWEELRDYKCHRRSSPDYTIYLSFGQYLFEPVNKQLVSVKLVPTFCTFWHQVAQEEGASSLHNEQISLQISNGPSFGSFDGQCLMDLDIDFSNLF